MRHALRVFVLCLSATIGLAAQAPNPQGAQSDRVITDPDKMMSVLSAWAEAGFLFKFANEGKLDDALVNMKMKNQSRWDAPAGGAGGGVWVVDTPTGFVSLRVWTPAPLSSSTNEALIVFTPPNERPIPDALLSHLLAKAERTRLDGGNILEIEMASERVPISSCRSQRTLKVRLDSGAMVLNGLRLTCEIVAK